MAAKFFVILINTLGRPVPTDRIEAALGKDDWLRFAFNQYVVYTSLTSSQIYSLLAPLLHPDDSLLVVESSSQDRYGRVPEIAREWLIRKRS
jgi:hypothetical protein